MTTQEKLLAISEITRILTMLSKDKDAPGYLITYVLREIDSLKDHYTAKKT